MLLRNINPPEQCNDTRIQMKALYKYVIEATIITGDGKGGVFFIPQISLIHSDHHFSLKRPQFPFFHNDKQSSVANF